MVNEAHLQPIYQYFLDNKQIIDIDTYEEKNLKIFSRNVLRMIQKNESDWEVFLPEGVADIIKTKKLFQKQ